MTMTMFLLNSGHLPSLKGVTKFCARSNLYTHILRRRTYTNIFSLSHSHTHTHQHTLTLSLSLSLPLSLTHTHSHTHARTHTHTHTRAHTQAHTYTIACATQCTLALVTSMGVLIRTRYLLSHCVNCAFSQFRRLEQKPCCLSDCPVIFRRH